MDKILSARVDDAVIQRIGALARQLGTTKKAVIEDAICCYAAQVERDQNTDVLEQTCGVWQREESPEETVRTVRQAFQQGMHRFHK